MKFGIELEIVGCTSREAAQAISNAGVVCNSEVYNHTTRTTWKVVTDASVPGGCEVVSPPMQVNEESFNTLRTVCQALNDMGVDVNKKCGVHVHIDVNNETPQTIANVFNRYKKFETQIDAFMPRSRRNSVNGYCKSLISSPDKTFTERRQIVVTDRYLKVNLKSYVKYGTIEFRQHTGSTNASKLIKWVSFLSDFVQASRELPTASASSQRPTLSRKRQAVVNLITNTPTSAEDIAAQIGSTAASVQSMICHIRKTGLTIIRLPRTGAYKLVDQTETVQAIQSRDELWRGIQTATRQYYARRAATLA